jgi:hypothetical protein
MRGNTRPQPHAHPRTPPDQKNGLKNGVSGGEKLNVFLFVIKCEISLQGNYLPIFS